MKAKPFLVSLALVSGVMLLTVMPPIFWFNVWNERKNESDNRNMGNKQHRRKTGVPEGIT
jgi:hypothetical protein